MLKPNKEFSFFLLKHEEILNKEKLLENYYELELGKVNTKKTEEFCLTLIHFFVENSGKICCIFENNFKKKFKKKFSDSLASERILSKLEFEDPVTYNLKNKDFDLILFDDFDKTVNRNKQKFQEIFDLNKEKTYYLEIIK